MKSDAASYRLAFTPAANREFRKLPREVQAALAPRIDALANDPRPEVSKRLQGPGELWSLREGDYRVVYQIRDTVLLVLLARVGHRKDVSRQLARVVKSL